MGAVFKFKQFEVNQQDCAMKINTDGVLVAALACDLEVTYLLDIGTGTGVIALMLAQHYTLAHIDAVEIDEMAANRAKHNFANSPFQHQLTINHCDFTEFAPTKPLDLIISNPPFYTQSLHAPDARKSIAKHTDLLFFDRILQYAHDHLADKGVLQLIIPVHLANQIKNDMLLKYALYVQKEWQISSFASDEPHRCVLRIGKKKLPLVVENLVIYEQLNHYSEAYKKILKPYFLAF